MTEPEARAKYGDAVKICMQYRTVPTTTLTRSLR